MSRGLLVDTQAFLDLRAGQRVSVRARRAFLDPERALFLSKASVWEMAIKVSLGKLLLDVPLRELVSTAVSDGGMRVLDIAVEHLYAVERLPWHHRDPFDRLLVCQARAEDLVILGRDEAFDAYGVDRIW